jgi:hypothetical protein
MSEMIIHPTMKFIYLGYAAAKVRVRSLKFESSPHSG